MSRRSIPTLICATWLAGAGWQNACQIAEEGVRANGAQPMSWTIQPLRFNFGDGPCLWWCAFLLGKCNLCCSSAFIHSFQ